MVWYRTRMVRVQGHWTPTQWIFSPGSVVHGEGDEYGGVGAGGGAGAAESVDVREGHQAGVAATGLGDSDWARVPRLHRTQAGVRAAGQRHRDPILALGPHERDRDRGFTGGVLTRATGMRH